MCEFPHTHAFALPWMGVSRVQCPKEVDVMGVAVRNAGIGVVSCCNGGSGIGVVRVSLLSRQLCTTTCVVELIFSTIFWDYNQPFFSLHPLNISIATVQIAPVYVALTSGSVPFVCSCSRTAHSYLWQGRDQISSARTPLEDRLTWGCQTLSDCSGIFV